ncbi:cell division protein [Bifidobacterium avesanii]|uniref:cell division protein n=1 Tax=Bifidobacterium avesanii TaxID=1798157 RepID=UPI003B849775
MDPEPAAEHVESPQPAFQPQPIQPQTTQSQQAQPAQQQPAFQPAPTEYSQAAQPTQPVERKGPRHAVQMPQMPDMRETGDLDSEAAQSRNEFTTVYDILDAIEQTLGEAKPGLFTPNVVKIDRDQLTGQIEELKKMLPVQLERASALMREAERRLAGAQTQASAIVASAQSRAADMIKEANEQAQFLAGQENVVALAQAKARATMDAAQAKADRLTQGADKYCTDVMESLDQQLDKLKQDVHAGLGVLYNRQQRAAQDYAAAQAGVQAAQAAQNARGAMPQSGEENQR